MDYSGNSVREESLRRLPSFSKKNEKESSPREQSLPTRKPSSTSQRSIITLEIGTNDTSISITNQTNRNLTLLPISDSRKIEQPLLCSRFENEDWKESALARKKIIDGESPTKSPKCIAVKVPNGGSTKKWWKLLDWLPGLKSLRKQRRLAYGTTAIKDTIVIESNQLDEYSMNLCTFTENDNKHRPV